MSSLRVAGGEAGEDQMKEWGMPILITLVGVMLVSLANWSTYPRIFDVFGGFALGMAVVMFDVNFLLRRAGIK